MCCGDDMVGCRRKWKAFKMCVGWYLDSINLAGDRAQKAWLDTARCGEKDSTLCYSTYTPHNAHSEPSTHYKHVFQTKKNRGGGYWRSNLQGEPVEKKERPLQRLWKRRRVRATYLHRSIGNFNLPCCRQLLYSWWCLIAEAADINAGSKRKESDRQLLKTMMKGDRRDILASNKEEV